jgi:hypothetical protein
MPIPKLQITNPEALELLQKIKSGEALLPLKAWLKKFQWFLITILVVIVLITALIIGKKLSERTPVPVFTPPDIENLSPTQTNSKKSDFSGLKTEIQNLNTDLPDPFIPVFDNQINLESPNL